MILRIIYLRFILLSVTVLLSGMARTLTEQERLYKDLFVDYDKIPRPVKDPTKPLNIVFTLELVKVLEVNAKKQRLGISSRIIQEWQDYFLRWNSSHYSGFESLNISPAKMWVPDIDLYNEIINKDRQKIDATTNVIIFSNGTCHWSVPIFVYVICDIDVSFFPLDQQKCSLRYGSLSYSVSEVLVERGNLVYPSKNFIKNGEWQLYNVSIKTHTVWDDTRRNHFAVIDLTLKMKRNSIYYIIEMLVPCFLISCLTMLGFILPPESGERMSLGMLTLLAMTFFQQLMMKMIPLQDFPIISQYFCLTTLEIGVALLVTTISVKFYHCSDKEMPRILHVVILDFLAKITRMKDVVAGEAEQSQLSFSSDGNTSKTQVDIELSESSSSLKGETVQDLNESGIGLVCFSDDRSLSPKSSDNSMKANRTQEEKDEDINPAAKWKKDWLLAVRIIDRFSMYMSFLIGVLTVIAVFIRAPFFWNSTE